MEEKNASYSNQWVIGIKSIYKCIKIFFYKYIKMAPP